MSPTLGGRRSPDAWSSPHDRARARLAERMTEPLEPEESAWLDAHLAGCEACREIDAAYQSDRAQLRGLRVIPPPRDLWARTSAALDQEQGRAGSGRRSRPARRRSETPLLSFPRGRWAPVGALGSIAAVMVVGFLVGNAIIGNGPAGSPSQGVALGSSATPNLVPTPVVVAGADVAWVSTDSDGSIVLRQAPVTGVCPPDKPTGCVPFDADASNVVTLSVKPKSVHQSPTSGQMIVFGVGQGGSGLTMYVINTGKSATPAPTPAATATTSATTTPTPTPVTSSATPATGSGGPSSSPGGASPSAGGPSPTTGGPPPSESPVDSAPPATASPTPKPSLTASIVPNVTPPPSAATLIAIASNVDVLSAETAAYSPDGAWFAFTARPHGDPNGSDIYLWHAGDAQATQLTKDGRSVFAGWVGNRLIGSRATTAMTLDDATPSAAPATDAAADSAGAELGATSFIIDPATRTKTQIPTAAWRPAVDPTGKFVVYWEGTVALDPDTGGWRTATGRLVIRAWPLVAGTAPTPSGAPSVAPAPASVTPSASPSASAASSAAASSSTSPKATKKPTASPSASPAASVAPSPSSSPSVPASPIPSPVVPSGLPASIASESGVDWAVAWDETGTHLALWIGDSGDRSFGRLSLLGVGANGLATANGAFPNARAALPGFALSDGHLAWATPPGTNAEGSRLTIFDYSGADSGERTGSGQSGADTVIVVQH